MPVAPDHLERAVSEQVRDLDQGCPCGVRQAGVCVPEIVVPHSTDPAAGRRAVAGRRVRDLLPEAELSPERGRRMTLEAWMVTAIYVDGARAWPPPPSLHH